MLRTIDLDALMALPRSIRGPLPSGVYHRTDRLQDAAFADIFANPAPGPYKEPPRLPLRPPLKPK